jgi:hypothetical protein
MPWISAPPGKPLILAHDFVAFRDDLPEAERPPIMPVPDHGADEWRSTLVTFDLDDRCERSMANGLDPARNEYVHARLPGRARGHLRDDGTAPGTGQPWGHGFMASFDAPELKHPVPRRFRRGAGKMEAGSGTFGPNGMWTCISSTAQTAMHQYLLEAPIDEHRTRVFLLNERNVAPDIKVMNEVPPALTPPLRSKGRLMSADEVILRYRDKLDGFAARGGRLDMASLRVANTKGDVICAIPCPARRETNAWVLDEVRRAASATVASPQAVGGG